MFSNLHQRAVDGLANRITALGAAVAPKVYSLTLDLPVHREPDWSAFKDAEGHRAIYTFELNQVGHVEVVKEAYIKTKRTKTLNRRFSMVVKNAPLSTSLYVGSTIRVEKYSVVQRLKEHLGYGSGRTYALNLSHVAFPTAFKVPITINVACYESASDGYVQELEDALWLAKRPMFGRLGRR